MRPCCVYCGPFDEPIDEHGASRSHLTMWRLNQELDEAIPMLGHPAFWMPKEAE